MSYKKLVRDNIPDIIKKNGEIPIIRVLKDEEYKLELERKLLEECQEVINSSGDERVEELADLLEVMLALGKIENKSFEDIKNVCNIKRQKRGAFNNKIYLEGIEEVY